MDFSGCLCLATELQGKLVHTFNNMNEDIRKCVYECRTASLVEWSACLTTDHEVAGSIPGTSTNFNVD